MFNPTFASHPSFGYTAHGTPYVFSTDAANPAPPPLSAAATITFWGTGAGDPAVGYGKDNGGYDMMAGRGFYFYGYAAGSDATGGMFYGGQLTGMWEGGTDNCVGPNNCMRSSARVR